MTLGSFFRLVDRILSTLTKLEPAASRCRFGPTLLESRLGGTKAGFRTFRWTRAQKGSGVIF